MSDSTTIPMKQCSKKEQCCHPEKQGDGWLPATREFFPRKRAQCWTCFKLYQKTYKAKHKEKIKATRQDHRKKNAERISNQQRLYRQTHREELRQKRIENVEGLRNYERKYRAANNEKYRAKYQRRRARQRKAEGTFSGSDVDLQYKSQNGKCYYCLKRVGKVYQIDHVIPISRGGRNSPDNIVITCPRCNKRKGNKTLREWLDILSDFELYVNVAQRIIEREKPST